VSTSARVAHRKIYFLIAPKACAARGLKQRFDAANRTGKGAQDLEYLWVHDDSVISASLYEAFRAAVLAPPFMAALSAMRE
jgi:hypothetical protein